MNFQRISERKGHRIPTNIGINEKQWTGRFGANGTSLKFICRNSFLYLETTVNL